MFEIVVMISGNGSNLQAIIDRCHEKTVLIRYVISSDSKAYGLSRAEKAFIPYTIISPKDKTRQQYSQELAHFMSCQQPGLIVLAGFMHVLTPTFTSLFPNTVNIHPSLLPKYPGLDTHKRVLESNDKTHGITIHWVTKELDAGPTIAQASVPVFPEDTPELLEERIHGLEHAMYPYVINSLAEGKLWNRSQ